MGTDNIDKDAATKQGIVVMNTPGGNTLSTAEHTIALLLALSRNIAPAYQSLREGKWDRNKYMGTQVAGKTLGIVGLGRIGVAVAKRARALEMNVLGYDPFMSKERAKELGIEPVDTVEAMLPRVDYLTVHTPLTDETRGLVGMAQLEKLKPGVRLINAARGGIYDEAALAEGLKSGKIGGVALDVYATEPCTDSPLFGLPGVVCTPHLGASTEEAQTQVAVEAVELLVAYLTTGAIRHAVNVASLDPQDIGLASRILGRGPPVGHPACRDGNRRVAFVSPVVSWRNCRERDQDSDGGFRGRVVAGALDQEVNLVNAELVLKQRGIELTEESRSEMGSFRSSMTAEVTYDHGQHRAAGTIFGQHMPRLVSLDDWRLEAYLDGRILVFRHHDVPGIIGAVGTIFGKHGINIAQMAVGRDAPGAKPSVC